MSAVQTGLLARNPWVARRPITVAEYHRMGEAGILGEHDRVELIEGQLVETTPIGSDHSGTVNALNYLLMRAVGDRGVVAVQNPVELSDITEPQPDFAVLKPRADFYRAHTPLPHDVLLLIEVARSSVAYDRRVKMPLYARHEIPEYWLVRLDKLVVEVHRSPGPDGYQSIQEVFAGAELEIEALPGVTIPASQVLG